MFLSKWFLRRAVWNGSGWMYQSTMSARRCLPRSRQRLRLHMSIRLRRSQLWGRLHDFVSDLLVLVLNSNYLIMSFKGYTCTLVYGTLVCVKRVSNQFKFGRSLICISGGVTHHKFVTIRAMNWVCQAMPGIEPSTSRLLVRLTDHRIYNRAKISISK